MTAPKSTDYALYFAIGLLTAWQGFQFALSREAIGSALLAGLVALKAKRSGNGKENGS